MMKNKIQNNKGFTIMETLVAIFIILLAITGPLVFSQSGLRAAFVSRDQITAFYLAQDAIEYVKNVRDNNIIEIINGNSNVNWLDGLSKCMGSNECTIDTISGQNLTCGPHPGCIDNDTYRPLKIDSKGYLGVNGSTSSIFAREIKIRELSPNDREAEVTVTIQWNTHEAIGKREIVVRENIYNWASGF
jgi:type II secretory pathway pseudopilin PulG